MKIKKIKFVISGVFIGSAFGLLIFAGFVYLFDSGHVNRLLRFARNDINAYVVMSGSMEPNVKTGSLVITKSSPSYSTGDVITFETKGGNLVTHRIVDVSPTDDGGGVQYFTKGDANEERDYSAVPHSSVVGVATHSIPYAGYAASFAKTPRGFVALVIIPSSIIIWEELKVLFGESRKGVKNTRMRERLLRYTRNDTGSGLPKWLLIVPGVASLLLVVAVSSAALTDIETSVGNVLAVYAPTPTPSPTGTPAPQNGGVVINEINWVGSNGDGLDEWVELYNTTGAPVDLTNWVIENLGTGNALPNRDVVITSGIIPAGGYFLISNHDEDDSRVNVIPDLVTSNVSLNNGGEQLVLKDDGGVIIDTANGLGTWFAGSSATPKKTMERINPAGPGTDQLNWQTASTHTGMDDSGDTDEFGTPKNVNGL